MSTPINYVHSAAACFNDFPNEIITKIIRTKYYDLLWDPPFIARPSVASYPAALQATRSVCKLWNDLIIADHHTWCRIIVHNDISTASSDTVVRIERFIQRIALVLTSYIPRCVFIGVCTLEWVSTGCIMRYLARPRFAASVLRTIDLEIRPGSASFQRTFIENNDSSSFAFPFNGATPDLTCLHMSCIVINWRTAPSLENLVTLFLGSRHFSARSNVDCEASPSELTALFTTARRLVTLHLIGLTHGRPNIAPIRPASIPLLYLTHLDVDYYFNSTCHIIEWLHLPSIQTLRVATTTFANLHIFMDHCGALLARVSTIMLAASDASEPTLICLLKRTPCLTISAFLCVPSRDSAIVDRAAYIQLLYRRYVLGAICSAWRFALHDTPSWWSYILIQEPICVDALAFWIVRAGTSPLTIRLGIPAPFAHVESVLDTLSTAMARCISLNICIHPSSLLPLRTFLRTVPPTSAQFLSMTLSQPSTIWTTTGFILLETPLPALAFIRLFQATIHWTGSRDFRGLTHLILVNCGTNYSPSWNDFGIISTRAPNITHVSFRLISCRELPSPNKARMFPSWAFLQHFDLELANDITIILLLTRMHFPALRVLHLKLLTSNEFDDLLDCARAFSSVETLHITLLAPPGVEWVASLLRTMPRISHIEIVRGYGQIFNALMDNDTGAMPCPALSDVSTLAPLAKVRVFIEARTAMSDSIKSVGFHRWDSSWDDTADAEWLSSQILLVKRER
ncbi:hypothetical protein C8F04DRAFT_1261061 [Mycena alexandri]|uniref:F-box domain-containing protein n=1 Tax=Mycena alexandri TaxID=1745969 RepID=A0AAD6SV50_9AGAR|nr:hypothetical protein C8F04DRAFT_1261061 [Mycena alexandri]